MTRRVHSLETAISSRRAVRPTHCDAKYRAWHSLPDNQAGFTTSPPSLPFVFIYFNFLSLFFSFFPLSFVVSLLARCRSHITLRSVSRRATPRPSVPFRSVHGHIEARGRVHARVALAPATAHGPRRTGARVTPGARGADRSWRKHSAAVRRARPSTSTIASFFSP